MTGFNHGMTGAAIALSVKRPELAIPLSFVSHYIIDLIPHFGFEKKQVFGKTFNNFLKADFVLALIMMAILAGLFPHHIFLIWSCMIVAAGPDIIWWFHRKTIKDWPKGLDRFTVWHFKVNNKSHVNHLYYDAAWLGLMWAIVIYIKIR